MAISQYASMRELIRRAIRDEHGSLWSDDVLDRAISDARRDYAVISGTVVGQSTLTATENGVIRMGEDFIAPIRFVGTSGFEIPLYSWKYLNKCFPDFRAVTGTELRGIVIDFDGYRNLRLFPLLPVTGDSLGTLYYRKNPDNYAIENEQAILHHVLYQLLLIENKAAAGNYYSAFLSDVSEENLGKRGINPHHSIRHGRFF